MLDSTAIISVLETYMRDKSAQLTDIIKFYPVNQFPAENGKKISEVANRYFIMHNAPVPDQKEAKTEA